MKSLSTIIMKGKVGVERQNWQQQHCRVNMAHMQAAAFQRGVLHTPVEVGGVSWVLVFGQQQQVLV